MRTIRHEVDVCVVGGGIAGLCAALAAARHGARAILMHERPVLGGNASSEIRVGISGAWGSWDRSVRETGIVEEIMLDTLRMNPTGNWQTWDLILHEKARCQKGLELLLNCSCVDGAMSGSKLRSVKGWQSVSHTWHEVAARLFIDASGDSILAEFSGARIRSGRESRDEFSEPNAPTRANPNVMGSSLIFAWRDRGSPAPFTPPAWAHKYPSDAEAPRHPLKIDRNPPHGMNGFYSEFGGTLDTIADAEDIRDELLKIGLGLVDHLKNHGDHDAENLELDWFGLLPGKRESRRYVGDYTLTENDIKAGTPCDDIVAYGGWPVDDHNSLGSLHKEYSHTFFKFPGAYPIPYRSLYSANVGNLLCAGRNISATHLGLCSTRVIATCGLIGQAVGTAAAIATKTGCSPREVGQKHMSRFQALLMDDDCWLPGLKRGIPEVTLKATLGASSGDPSPLVNGVDRPCEDEGLDNAWTAKPGDWVEFRFNKKTRLASCRMVFDSDLLRKLRNMPLWYPRGGWNLEPPKSLVKGFSILTETDDGKWVEAARVSDSHQRLVKLEIDAETTALRLRVDSTWGAEKTRIFAFEAALKNLTATP